ncbi:MAG TPA: hypothetical protein VFD52_03540 [Clostridia bacterium]|nr:hypothetical protein [Clostridia bacterium]
MHIKVGGERLKSVFELCNKYNTKNRVVFGVERKEDVQIVREWNKNALVLAFIPKLSDLKTFTHCAIDIIRLWEQWVEPEIVKSIHKVGKAVWVMANNRGTGMNECGYTTQKSLVKWKSLNVNGVILNNVESAVVALNN